jgi:hypothetical protein
MVLYTPWQIAIVIACTRTNWLPLYGWLLMAAFAVTPPRVHALGVYTVSATALYWLVPWPIRSLWILASLVVITWTVLLVIEDRNTALRKLGVRCAEASVTLLVHHPATPIYVVAALALLCPWENRAVAVSWYTALWQAASSAQGHFIVFLLIAAISLLRPREWLPRFMGLVLVNQRSNHTAVKALLLCIQMPWTRDDKPCSFWSLWQYIALNVLVMHVIGETRP